MNCPFCDSAKLRVSRFRREDIWQYLIFRRAVRCRACDERSYVSLAQFHIMERESKLRRETTSATATSDKQPENGGLAG